MLLEHSNRRHVDRHAQCLGQFATESHEIENRVPWFQIDEKVYLEFEPQAAGMKDSTKR